MIKTEDIKAVADFSKLQFNDKELSIFEMQFANIINFVKQINDAKVSVKERYDIVLDIEDLRPDITGKSLPIEAVLQNAPRKQGRYFAVPKVRE
jgi:aspartyl-tRNA(Asn)/glutamyl-tRNA(Gln) amidotransferase subunit C